MASIRIPESVLPGIKAIGLLNNKEVSSLNEILRKLPKGANMDDVKLSFESISDSDNSDLIAEAIFSFGYLLVRNENSEGDLSKKLTDSFLLATEGDEVSQSLSEILPERLNDILILADFLIPTFEAYRVVWDNNNVFRSTEISSEIVLLNDKLYQTPASGVILNKLSILMRDKDDVEVKYVMVLDDSDLRSLKDQVEIALQETEQMKRGYSKFINFIKL